ncbi:MAG: hypothetical protein PWQ77_628 [Kosmotogales bacterium]|nr:hypothetical protein [Kosmotogales bacterium]
MSKYLKEYLDNIDSFIFGKTSAERKEILAEIESYVLNNAERDYGNQDEESIRKAINDFGKPEEVAEKYVAEEQIIAPIFKNYLFMYSFIVFSVHMGLLIVGMIAGNTVINRDINSFIPLLEFFGRLPVTFIFDFGVVTLIFMILTRHRKKLRLPYLGGFLKRRAKKKSATKKGLMIELIFSIIGTFALLFAFIYGPVFISTTPDATVISSNIINMLKTAFFIGFVLMSINTATIVFNFLFQSRLTDIISGIVVLGILYTIAYPNNLKKFSDFINIQMTVEAYDILKGIIILITLLTVFIFSLNVIDYTAYITEKRR